MDPSSSLTKKKSTKLSVKNQTCFKKSKMKTNLSLLARRKTILKKAEELSILCDIELCLICYDRDGELVDTYPKDQSKVRLIAERFSNLSVEQKRKKSTNLSQFLNKKLEDEKILEMEDSLESRRLILKDRLQFLYTRDQTVSIPENSTDLSSSSVPIVDPVMNNPSIETLAVSTDSSMSSNLPSNFSIFLYDHNNDSFTRLANSVSSFEQPQIPMMQTQNPLFQFDQLASLYQTPSFGQPAIPYDYDYSDMLLGEQDMRGCNNIDLPMAIPPPLTQTQTPVFQIDQFALWNQTQF